MVFTVMNALYLIELTLTELTSIKLSPIFSRFSKFEIVIHLILVKLTFTLHLIELTLI